MRVSRPISKNYFEPISLVSTALLLVVLFLVTGSASRSLGADETEPVASAEDLETPESVDSSGDTLLRFKSGFDYLIKKEAAYPEDAEAYEHIAPFEKQQFQNTRTFILKKVAALLDFSRLATGTGLMIGEKIYHTLKPREISSAYLDGYFVTDERTRPNEAEETMAVPASMSIKERGFMIARKVLAAIDRQLWRQAPLVSRSDEFGIMVSLGAQVEFGKTSQGRGGSFSLGLSLGYNRAKKAVLFEIYREQESFHTALPAVSIAAVLGKLGVFIRQSNEAQTGEDGLQSAMKGQALYPPGFPMFAETTPSFFGMGFSSGVGVPPPPISDAFAYINNLNRKTLVQISISPLFKGFVRFQSDLGFEFIKKVMKRDPVGARNSSPVSAGNSCQAFFAVSN